MVQETLQEHRPSKDETFSNTVQLINACKTGNVALVSELIQENPELVDSDDWSPLHYAAREGHADVVKLLLEAGANPDPYEHMLRNHYGITTLEVASVRGFKEVVALIEAARRSQYNLPTGDSEIRDALKQNDLEQVFARVKRSPELVNAADDDGNTPLHRAAEATSPNFELIDFLLEHGADLHATNFLGFKPIHLTLWRNHLWGSKRARWMLTGYLLARGAEYNINIASAAGDLNRVRSLLKADASLANFLDTCKKRPLSCAAEFGHTEIVKLLLDHDADPNAPEASTTKTYPLYAAAQGNHLEMAKMLLAHGADPDAYVDSAGSAMSCALDGGFQEIANLIASYGGSAWSNYYAYKGNLPVAAAMLKSNPSLANDFISTFNERLPEETQLELVNLVFKFGADAKKVGRWTLFMAENWPKVLKALFEHGVDPNVTDNAGKTNLHDLARHGNIKAAEVMLEHGADIHAKDEVYKATPLAWAVIHGQKEMVQWFLEKGARQHLPDDEPWATPLFWAERKGYTEIADLLRTHGATA